MVQSLINLTVKDQNNITITLKATRHQVLKSISLEDEDRLNIELAKIIVKKNFNVTFDFVTDEVSSIMAA